MAVYTDLFVDRGSSFAATIELAALNGSPLNLTGLNARGRIRRTYTSATFIEFGIEFPVDLNKGEFYITLTSAQTQALVPGRYVFDVEIFNADDSQSDVERVLEGQLEVTPSVFHS
jgi:hypothetical protein